MLCKIVVILCVLLVSSFLQANSIRLKDKKNLEVEFKHFKPKDIITDKLRSSRCIEKLGEVEHFTTNNKHASYQPRRHKRDLNQNNPYTIEVLAIVDESMQNFHKVIGTDIKEYVLKLLSTTANVFADPTVGNMINVAVVDILSLHESLNASHLLEGTDVDNLLDKFKQFMNEQMSKKLYFDVGLLLTRDVLCSSDDCKTTGYATVGGMCSSDSYAIIQDTGLATGYTIAHEIGHLLGARHDDNEAVCSKYLHKHVLHIMAAGSNPDDKFWSWSPCSRHSITEFLESDRGSCLLNKPSKNMLKLSKTLNQIPNPNIQCELAYGKTAKAMIGLDSSEIHCNKMQCQARHTFVLPYVEGTECNNGKLCYHGQCVETFKSKHINGGWGEYKKIGQCTRLCNGGVQWYGRECNNPTPNNGRYCIGKHRIFKSCNTQDCPAGTIDIREQQCTAQNNRTHTWAAVYNLSPKYQCELACKNQKTERVAWLKEKVIDGTPCNQYSSDKCISGICRPAGCDNKLNSDLKWNKCGVCSSSDRMCKHISESISLKQIVKLNENQTFSNYFNIPKIPKGAVNVEIVQHGHRGDGNHMVEDVNGETSKFGNPFSEPAEGVYNFGGLEYKYTTNKTIVKITSPEAKHLQRDLTLKVFLAEHQKGDFSIDYSYWIQK